ncbi:hypothetical protein [Methanoculleus thermophilus]|uniref:Uncharacterized protein n=1 Tax=Methanoculleus thermophilus TaxID=2200 RepID=A0A1G9A299_9EURY|nr:hypothetical protein [Methanoculleus thermophilus]SDK21519.1 hypothetical protein SAMN04488571_105143 [Methanoculleus thermophilus]
MSWEKKRVWIIVKTYPEYSRKSRSEVACTAGITEEGDWIRLYPIPTKHYIGSNKIHKFDLVEVTCQKAKSEKLRRKESYKVKEGSDITIIDRSLSGTSNNKIWDKRNKLLLDKVDLSLSQLDYKYKEDKTSLGLIRPKEILKFYSRRELEIYIDPNQYRQGLDGSKTPIIQKIPYPFAYHFKCSDNCLTCSNSYHDILCEDWELLEAYRRWGREYGDIQILWEKLYEKFYTWMINERDLYFVVGMHSLQPTWLIIGLYYPPKNVEPKHQNQTLDKWF